MFFITILFLTTMLIAGAAAYFSIYGLGIIFSGAFISVMIMATALEIGKLVSVSFLYRFWGKISFLIKTYLIFAIMVLMLITSTGIFGYLSSAYQEDTIPLKEINSRVVLLQQEKDDLVSRKKQMDDQIAKMPSNFVTGRQRLTKTFKPEYDKINNRLPVITSEIYELSNKKIQQEVHTGPIIFIAEALGKDIDDSIKYMIFLIIFVFDPLAVILTLGMNIAIIRRSDDLKKDETAIDGGMVTDIVEQDSVVDISSDLDCLKTEMNDSIGVIQDKMNDSVNDLKSNMVSIEQDIRDDNLELKNLILTTLKATNPKPQVDTGDTGDADRIEYLNKLMKKQEVLRDTRKDSSE